MPEPIAAERKPAPIMMRAAETRPASYQEADNSIEIVWTTGAAGMRFDWYDGEYYIEELSLEPGAVRLDRLNAGACLLDSHQDRTLSSVLGSVVPGTVSIGNGVGSARVRLAKTPDVADTVAKIIDGHIRSVSVGYAVYTYLRTETEGEKPHLLATDWEPIELSMVAVPFDAGAQVRARSAAQGGTHPCTIRGTAASVEKEPTMPQAGQAADENAADNTNTTIEGEVVSRTVEEKKAGEQQKRAAVMPAAGEVTATRILEMCGRSPELGNDFAAELIRTNDATPLTENDLLGKVNERLLAKRKIPPIDARAGASGTESEGYRQAIEDAITLRANPGIKMDAPRVEAAREFRGMTLMEQARDYLSRTGMRTSGMGRLDIAGAALGMRYGALTTSDFANALSTASNKRLRAAFTAAPQTFRPIVSLDTLPDFKPAQIIGLGDAPALLVVPENGEFKRGAISDSGLTYRLATYGRIIAITRQAIVNDDQSLFNRIPTMFGRKAADLESDLVWGILLSNPNMADGVPLFHASHGNLAAVGTAITVAAVAAGEQAMLQQTSAEGGFLTIRPEYLIVGPAKKVEAQQFLTAVTAQQASQVNPYPGNLQLIVEPRITGNQWFLSANPDAFDTIVLAHLLGQEELFTDTRVGFDVDGIENKARLDVGGAAIDYRGLYKNPGN
jgi:phage major head subunit gpT-like protein/phage head maturation protease